MYNKTLQDDFLTEKTFSITFKSLLDIIQISSQIVIKTYSYCLSLFIVILHTLLNELKLLKKPKKTINSSFLSYHARYYGIVQKIDRIFLNYISYSIMIWKVNVFNSCISEQFFNQIFLDIDMNRQDPDICVALFIIWTWSVKYLKNYFLTLLKYYNWSP